MSSRHFNKAARRLLPCLLPFAPAAAAADETPVRLEAENLRADGDIIDARGDVRAFWSDYQLCAGRLQYEKSSGMLRAAEDVRLKSGGDVLRAGEMTYDTEEGVGAAADFSAELAEQSLRLRGADMRFQSPHLSGRDVVVTSCKPESELWRLRVGAADADLANKSVNARNARFEFLGVPVMYLPYAKISYSNERRSGFLFPEVSLGSGGGAGARAPFYVNLADNYDWTITPNWSSKHGLELGNEFRFLTPQAQGAVNLNGTIGGGEGRGLQSATYLFEQGAWRFSARAENVSDDDYLIDFGRDTYDKARHNLPRAALLEYRARDWSARLEAESFKTLGGDFTAPHRVFPALSFRHAGAGAGFGWETDAQYARFLHNDAARPSGARFLWRGRVSRYFHAGAFAITPGVGGFAAAYRARAGDDAAFFVPHARLLAERRWRAAAAASLRADYRLRAAFIYAPHRRQDDAPLYDTARRQQSAGHLYEWNRYAGGDRAADAKRLVYGGEYRLYDDAGGREVFFLGAAQHYHFRRSRVILPGETPVQKGLGNALIKSRLTTGRWRLSGEVEWNARQNTFERAYFNARYQSAENRIARLGYAADDDETLSLGGAARLGDYVEAAFSTSYILDEDRYSRSVFALRLRNACDCWRLSLEVEDLVVKRGENDVQFYIGMTFTGLGSVGGRQGSVLEQLR